MLFSGRVWVFFAQQLRYLLSSRLQILHPAFEQHAFPLEGTVDPDPLIEGTVKRMHQEGGARQGRRRAGREGKACEEEEQEGEIRLALMLERKTERLFSMHAAQSR